MHQERPATGQVSVAVFQRDLVDITYLVRYALGQSRLLGVGGCCLDRLLVRVYSHDCCFLVRESRELAGKVARSATHVDDFLAAFDVEEAGVKLVDPGLCFKIATVDFSAATKVAD